MAQHTTVIGFTVLHFGQVLLQPQTRAPHLGQTQTIKPTQQQSTLKIF